MNEIPVPTFSTDPTKGPTIGGTMRLVCTNAAFHYGNKLRRKASREVHNDAKRKAWLDGDEGLYNAWQRSKKTKDAFVRANRAEIDKVIDVVNSGTKPAHYLAYGG